MSTKQQDKKKQKVKSPIGKLSWACLREPEEFQGKSTGKLSIRAQFSKDESEALISMIEQAWEAYAQAEKFKAPRNSVPQLGYSETQAGDIQFKFKTVASFTSKSGETIKRIVPVFDAKGKPVASTVRIGNGSLGRVAFTLSPFISGAVYGVSLQLDAVQLLKLEEYGANTDASQFGFEEEEGFFSHDEDVEEYFNSSEPDDSGPSAGDF